MRAFGIVLAAALAAITSSVSAQTSYKTPPEPIRKVLDTPPTPGVSVNPVHTHLLLLHRRALPPVSDLSAPMLRLGGSRINPDTNGPHGPRRLTGFTLRDLSTGKEIPLEIPADANVGSPSWNADGSRFLFTITLDNGIELWAGDLSGEIRRLTGPMLNAAGSASAQWMPDQKSVLALLVPAGRGPMPQEPRTPAGPAIQESDGRIAPAMTFQDLLKNEHDERLFDWVMTAQLVHIDIETGAQRSIGAPAIYGEVSPSPSGEFLLISRVQRPYSYSIGWGSFPETYEVVDFKTGAAVRQIAQVPLRDNIPIQGVQTGPRGIGWIETRPATLMWAEALDGGDPRAKVPHRDRLLTFAAPFGGEPREWMKIEHRFRGATFLERTAASAGDRAMVSEFERERRWARTWLVGLDAEGGSAGEARLVFDRSVNDRYNDPGSPVMKRLAHGGGAIRVEDEHVYLRGEGATPEGSRPFLDRMSLADFKAQRLWRNEGECYETVVSLVERQGRVASFMTSRESLTEPPNLFERGLAGDAPPKAVTTFPDPLSELRKIRKEIVKYTRDDGTPLSATMYLPPDYREGERLPLLIWAYPNEVSDAATAGQVAGSPYRFTQIGGSSHLFLLLAGYAVMDDASMPVIGDPETMNDTFVKQIVANAKAAIDKATEMGVADPTRVAVAGHSYGAFMTANLLAHAPEGMFRAGCARSGAFNRTLTPFGFQSERRSFWEARDVYLNLSPFTYADRIKTPLLIIHGAIDNNPGTHTMQSERLFQAIKGNGGTARLVLLPHESHGYMARESVLHTLAEMIEWFDKYVKPTARAEK